MYQRLCLPRKINLEIKIKKTKWLLLPVVVLLMTTSAWGWGFVKAEGENPKAPRVLLIGDSITAGYKWFVTRQLAEKATVDAYCNPYNQANNSWHNELKGVLSSNGPYTVIHFNIGLHGLRKGNIPEGQFEPLTGKCLETIRQYAPGARIIWASTTPVITTNRPFALDPLLNPVVVAHNAMAAKVMQKYGIPINDLYTLMAAHVSLSHGDAFHWEGEAGELMGGAVARAIEALLQFNERTR